MVKAMWADGPDRGTGCRQAVCQVPTGIIRGGMAEDVDRWLGSPDGRDRCSGAYRHRLPCEPGDIGPAVPRTLRHRPTAVLGNCARGAREIDRVILARFVRGPSASGIGEILPRLPGRAVPPATVRPHRRDLGRRRRRLPPSSPRRPQQGPHARRCGVGALMRPVPVAPGLLPIVA